MLDWMFWTALAVFIPLSISFMGMAIVPAWVEYRSRSKALDVLRVYAERGDEPPPSVTDAIAAVGSGHRSAMGAAPVAPMPVGAFSKPTRENHLAHVAGSTVCLLGSVGIAWWRMPDEGAPGALVMWAVVFAIFFAGSLAARLVGVFTTPSGRPRDDR